jgi:hypothetical protein
MLPGEVDIARGQGVILTETVFTAVALHPQIPMELLSQEISLIQ